MLSSELKYLCNKVSLRYFHKPLPKGVKVNVNNRLSRACGQEYYDYRTEDYHVELGSLFLNDDFPRVIVIDCIKHELCHLYLAPRHLKRAHGRVFKHLLKRVKGVYTVPALLSHYNPQKCIFAYQCQKCGKILYFTYSNANKNWRCSCGSQIKPLGYIHENIFLKTFLHEQYHNPEPKLPQHIKSLITKKVQLSLF